MIGRIGLAGLTFGAGVAGIPWAASLRSVRGKGGSPDWDAVRKLFDLDPGYVHLAGLLLASHPQPVRDALSGYRARLDRNPALEWEAQSRQAERRVRQSAAKHLRADASAVALTGNTTMGLGLIYNGIQIRPDQEALATTHDHAVTYASLGLRAQKTGFSTRRAQLYDDPAKASAAEIVHRVSQAVSAKTRVLAVTWVHSSTGVRLPLASIAEAVKRANSGRSEDDRILLCVDGVHGLGVEDVDLPSMGCDFFAAGCHKWLFGPRGTGVLWGRPESQRHVQPTFASFSDMSWGGRMTPGGFHSFEHRWALDQAFELHARIGKAEIAARVHELARHCKEELAKMRNVKLYTPLEDALSSGIVCFDVSGIRQDELVDRLRERKIVASTTPYSPSYARLAPGLLNTHEEVDKALAAIREMV